ncbi:type I toxin-antitoxin system Fst family toxin [Ligilactobacillus aviarius]
MRGYNKFIPLKERRVDMIHLLALVVAPIVVNCVTELFKEWLKHRR